MSELSRIGVAIDSDLLQSFDALIAEQGYSNRSEAFRDLIREALQRRSAERSQAEVVAVVSLVYDHHTRMLSDKLTDMQHASYHEVHSTLHVHLDHNNCLEVLVLRGKAAYVRKIADALIATKGVKHGQFSVAATGDSL
jgi:CopG family transcriptional regulator, nickel-responsive regulator